MKQAIKIRELKKAIKDEQNKLEDLFINLDPQKEAELPEEEQTKNKEEFKNAVAVIRANVKGLQEQLKITRMNKTGSSFFEWLPHVGLNRRQARGFNRLRAQGKLKKK